MYRIEYKPSLSYIKGVFRKKNICYNIKIEHRYIVEICPILTRISLHKNLVVVGFIATCMGLGYIVVAALQATRLLQCHDEK